MGHSAVQHLVDSDPRPEPRADARRNLDRLVTAAREAIDDVGLDVTAHEIARRAGVGIGTFYRRVGSREALLEAVSREVIDEIIRSAEDALEHADPWRGFEAFAQRFVQLRTESCGINEALGGADLLHLDEELAVIRERIRSLVERAQEAGSMRQDIDWTDVPFLLANVITVSRSIGLIANDDQWRTNLTVLLDGLHATTAGNRTTRTAVPVVG